MMDDGGGRREAEGERRFTDVLKHAVGVLGPWFRYGVGLVGLI